jgi:hypothetical protein
VDYLKRVFALIELIAVIALSRAILIPALQLIRDQAKRITYSNNIK